MPISSSPSRFINENLLPFSWIKNFSFSLSSSSLDTTSRSEEKELANDKAHTGCANIFTYSRTHTGCGKSLDGGEGLNRVGEGE